MLFLTCKLERVRENNTGFKQATVWLIAWQITFGSAARKKLDSFWKVRQFAVSVCPSIGAGSKKKPIVARLQLQMLKMSTLRSTVSISVNMMCPVQRPQVVFFKKEALETWGKKEKTR